jgi:putative transcriptional regulator
MRRDPSNQTLIALESGRYSPSLELAFELAHAFGVTIEEIFEWRPDRSGAGRV